MRNKVLAVIFILLIGLGFGIFVTNAQKKVTVSPVDDLCKDCNVVLITMTNLRYDHVSNNGYFRKTTPNIDSLMEKSVVFKNAFSHASWTLPEAMTIYTGLYPFEHKVTNRREEFRLKPDTLTMVDSLKSQGYTTAIFSGGYDYDEQYGLTNRFEVNEKCRKTKAVDEAEMQYGELGCSAPKAVNWLKGNSNKKFFMQVQGYDAHCPFNQGDHFFDTDYSGGKDFSHCMWTFKKEKSVIKNGVEYRPVLRAFGEVDKYELLDQKDIFHLESLYDEAIFNSDKYIGAVLREIESLGLADKTIVIFTSEHGDIFGKHGRFMRGGPLAGTFYDDVLHVPLVIKIPKIDHKEIDSLVGQVDLFPTLMSMLGIKIPTDISGKSVVQSILGKSEGDEYVYAGSTFTPEDGNLWVKNPTRTSAIRSNKWKLIKTEMIEDTNIEYELFNLVTDPQELTDVKESELEIYNSLREKLISWENKTN